MNTAEVSLALQRLASRAAVGDGDGPAPRIGLVLGAGGLAGRAFHAGALSALTQLTEWEPSTADILLGTSAGSITATLLRAGLPTGDLAADLLHEPLSPKGEDLLARRGPRPAVERPASRSWLRPPRLPSPRLLARVVRNPWLVPPSVLAAATLPAGQVPVEGYTGGMRRLMGRDWPEMPLWITAVCLDDGHRAVFGRDQTPRTDVATAIAASCAIPGYFAPVEIAGREWVDGGVHSPTNADVLADHDLDVVVAVASMSSAQDVRGVTPDVLFRHRFHRMLQRELRAVRRRGIPSLVIEPNADDLEAMGVNPMHHARMPDVVRQAHRTTRHRLGGTLAGKPRGAGPDQQGDLG